MFFAGDPERAADMADDREQRWLESLPVCCVCNEHIQDEYIYQVDGRIYCPACIEDMKIPNEEH